MGVVDVVVVVLVVGVEVVDVVVVVLVVGVEGSRSGGCIGSRSRG
jgi:hypothetical protein